MRVGLNQRGLTIIGIVLLGIFSLALVVAFSRGEARASDGLRVPYYRLLYKIQGTEKDFGKLKKVHALPQHKEGRDSAPCVACHGRMVEKGKEESRDAKKPLHQAMMTAPMLGFECTDCHPKVDVRPRTPTQPSRKVDRDLCSKFPCHAPEIMLEHGKNNTGKNKEWLLKHPRVAKAVGFDECMQCHFEKGELDICLDCHNRGGFRPSSHRAIYSLPASRIFTKIDNPRVVETRWKGFHFVFARDALKQVGVPEVTASTLPLGKVTELPCQFCHVIEKWCTRCHIKHAPGWLPSGHAVQARQGADYCFNCHDEQGSKCLACHEDLSVAGR